MNNEGESKDFFKEKRGQEERSHKKNRKSLFFQSLGTSSIIIL